MCVLVTRNVAGEGYTEVSVPLSPWGNGDEEAAEEPDVDLDEVLELLGNRRRRYVWLYLSEQSGPVSLQELSRVVAARESDVEPADVEDTVRKSVYTSLRQYHCPKLAEHGLVRYDREAGVVEPAAGVEDAYGVEVGGDDNRVLDATAGALAVTVGVVLAGWSLAVPPFAWLSAWGVAVVLAVTAAVAAFVYVAFARSTCWVSVTDVMEAVER